MGSPGTAAPRAVRDGAASALGAGARPTAGTGRAGNTQMGSSASTRPQVVLSLHARQKLRTAKGWEGLNDMEEPPHKKCWQRTVKLKELQHGATWDTCILT